MSQGAHQSFNGIDTSRKTFQGLDLLPLLNTASHKASMAPQELHLQG
jgi:hypothetical protein